MNIRRYETAAAFKQALEQRLRSAAPAGTDFARHRQLLVFDRFLARVAFEFGETVTLKGGLALELRIERARTTKDIDLRVMGAPDAILERLQTAGRRDLGDFRMCTRHRGNSSTPCSTPARMAHGIPAHGSGSPSGGRPGPDRHWG